MRTHDRTHDADAFDRVGCDPDTGRPVAITLHGGRIRREATSLPASPGTFVTRGWVDVQVNGFGGHDVNAGDMTPEQFESMTRALYAEGVARYLPTVVTNGVAHMRRCLAAVATARAASPAVAASVPGIHLEGPFVSPVDGARGAHPREHVVPADRVLFDDLQTAADGGIVLVTLAPEAPGALDLIAYLTGHEIVVAIGHSLADSETIRDAVAAGARLSTHLGNGVPAELPRHPNPIWDQLADDTLTASAIFDGHHLPDSVMRVLYRVKGPERLILTSDAVALARMAPGVYEGQVGGKVELRADGRLTLFGTPYLAGSASSLLDGVHTAVTRAGIPVPDALRMVSSTPTTLLRLPERDDVTVVQVTGSDVRVLAVAVEGNVVYGHDGEHALGEGGAP
ncbi:MAG: hypothetical protein R6W77_06710 [Trueperaceae bacterium]